jgi:hypothetical protein
LNRPRWKFLVPGPSSTPIAEFPNRPAIDWPDDERREIEPAFEGTLAPGQVAVGDPVGAAADSIGARYVPPGKRRRETLAGLKESGLPQELNRSANRNCRSSPRALVTSV